MTEKRFKADNSAYEIWDNDGFLLSFDQSVDLLNELSTKCSQLEKENEELKQAYTQLKHRHSLLYDVCIDAECDRDSYCKDIASLEKENEQLKRQIAYHEKAIVDAINSVLELPSASIFLLNQWLDALEEYDSIEDMKNTFSEKIKELEE